MLLKSQNYLHICKTKAQLAGYNYSLLYLQKQF